MIRLIPSGNPRGLGLGYVRGGVHMLLILSPIVQSGGLIDSALSTRVIYYNISLRERQPTPQFYISFSNAYSKGMDVI